MSGYVNVHVLNTLSEHANVLASSAVAAFQDGADQLPPFLFLPVPSCQSERAPKRDGQQPNLIYGRCRSSSKTCFKVPFSLALSCSIFGTRNCHGCGHGRMMQCLSLGLLQREPYRKSINSSVLVITDFSVTLDLFSETFWTCDFFFFFVCVCVLHIVL